MIIEVVIRECQMSDATDIYILNKNEMAYDYPLDKTIYKLQTLLQSYSDKIFVALIENKIVGYVHGCDYDVIYMGHLKNIMGIAVNHSYRNMGIGR